MNDADNTVRLDFVTLPSDGSPDVFTYEAFADCFYQWKTDWEDPDGPNSQFRVTPEGWESSAQGDFEGINEVFDSIDLAEYMMLAERCNGVCKQGLFAFAGVIAGGIPDVTCANVMAPSF